MLVQSQLAVTGKLLGKLSDKFVSFFTHFSVLRHKRVVRSKITATIAGNCLVSSTNVVCCCAIHTVAWSLDGLGLLVSV